MLSKIRVIAVLAAAVLVTAGAVWGFPGGRSAGAATAAPGGKGPVGWDTYRRLDQLPYLATAVQTLQSSSFDRTGGNADWVTGPAGCLAGSQPGACVLAQDSGPGEISAMWFTWDGAAPVQPGRITVELDGTKPVDRPLKDLIVGAQGAPFVFPLVASGGQRFTPPGEVGQVNGASGGAYVNVPMPYTRSMRVTLQNPTYFHVTYRHFPDADGVRTFDPTDRAQDVLDLLRSAGLRDPKPARPDATARNAIVRVPAGGTTDVATLTGPGTVTELRLRLPDVVGNGIADYGGANPLRPRVVTDDGRAFGAGGHSEFTVAVDPANQGVRLWRRLETSVGRQVAHVLVDGVPAGDWAPLAATPGQQWADESLTLPAARTAGRSQLNVRTDFASSTVDFNEFRYSAESLVDGLWARTDTLDLGSAHTSDEHDHAYVIAGQTWEGQRALNYPLPGAAAVAASADELTRLRLRITFDGQSTVDAPIGEFFGSGLGENPVRSLFFAMETGADGWYTTWWPMPFRQSATVSLVNGTGRDLPGIEARVVSAPDPVWNQDLGPVGRAGYFTAEAHRGATTPGRDWLFADRSGRGKFVGVTQTMYEPSCCPALEGDERVYVDGAASPALHGTGTEDFYAGGWYFASGNFSVALAGETGHDRPGTADNRGVYRLMLADAVDFRTGLRFGIEHGPVDDAAATYGSTAYLYTQPTAATVRSDTVEPGDPASRTAHAYTEAGAATQADLRATYEGDRDDVPVDDGLRTTAGEVSMRLALAPGNGGALLRRTGDQLGAAQAATVLVDGHEVGRWIQPAANGAHRWRVAPFPLPATDTVDRTAVTVTLRPDPAGWSAARYQVDSLVAPVADTAAPAAPVVRADGGVHANRLQWTVPADDVGVVAYRVYASDTADGAGQLVTTTPGTGFRDTAHAANTTRWYRVMAVDAAGHAGPASAAVSATVRKRTVSDVDGDGKDDAVVFTGGAAADVFVSTSNGSAFPHKGWQWADDFAGGTQVPFTGDVDGDGEADAISFGRGTAGEVDVALSTGAPGATPGAPGGFEPRQVWLTGFATGTTVPVVGDFDGDGRTDIAAFTRGDDHRVLVALSTGSGFGPPAVWHNLFALGDEVPAVGDFDGDGRDDVVTFTRGTDHKAFVALSDGTRFAGDGWLWSDAFCFGGEIPAVGDVDGDGRDDAVTFTRGTTGDVFVSRSDGGRFKDTGLRWHDKFALGTETPGIGDFTGDGRADIVTFTQGTTADVFVSHSDGTAFVDTGWLWNDDFARAGETPRPSTA